MADFFTRLAARTLGLAPVIRPRRPARFDPAGTEVDGAPEPERLAGTAPPEAAGRPPHTDEKQPAAEAQRPGPAPTAEPEPLVRTKDPLSEPRRSHLREAPARRARRPGLAVAAAAKGAASPPTAGRTEAEGSPPASRRAGSEGIEAGLPRAGRPAVAPPRDGRDLRPAPLVPFRRRESGRIEAVVRARETPPAVASSPPEASPSASRSQAEPTASAAAAPPAAPSSIQVTIGRVEVRAVTVPAAAPPPSPPRRTGPALSLEEYLKQRREGRR